MAIPGGPGAGLFVPWVLVRPSPLHDVQMAALGRKRYYAIVDHLRKSGVGPLQDSQVAGVNGASDDTPEHRLRPSASVHVGPHQGDKVAVHR